MIIKKQPYRTQSPVRSKVFKLFLKVAYVCMIADLFLGTQNNIFNNPKTTDISHITKVRGDISLKKIRGD